MLRSLTQLWKRLVQLYTKDIWQPSHIGEKSVRGWWYATLRVISITITGILATRALARAAALSFTTLLSLGPLVALAVLVAGFVLSKDDDPDLIANKLNDMITFIAPQVDQYESIRQHKHHGDLPEFKAGPEAKDAHTQRGQQGQGDVKAQGPSITSATTPSPFPDQPVPSALEVNASGDSGNTSAASEGVTAESERKVRPEIVKLINNFVNNARSGTIGGISVISLIIIVIFLFSAIEDVFNDIWGVRRTRSWLTRVVFYWAILTLGTLLFFIGVGSLSAATFINFFKEKLPFGPQMLEFAQFFIPVAAVALIIGMLTLFYRFVPNTHVFWRAALAGAITMAVLLVGNNMLAFAYFSRIKITQSLYGSLGIMPVLMLGLYIFWVIVLVGGQVSYAVQNVHFRNSQIAWSSLSHSSRERLSLVVLLTIARRFQACLPPCTVAQLGDTIKAPAQILNVCLTRLIDLKLITPVPPPARGDTSEYLYQPARPLNRISLGEFKELFENLGEDPSSGGLDRLDPVSAKYHHAILDINRERLFTTTLEELFRENPIDESRPPFALGERIGGPRQSHENKDVKNSTRTASS